jgi:hypothetical protein
MRQLVLTVTAAAVGTFAFLGMTTAPAFADSPPAIGDGSQSGDPSNCNGTGFGVGLLNVDCAPVNR